LAVKTSKLTDTFSRVLQLTAGLVFLFALWRLWLLWLDPEWFLIDTYNLYSFLSAMTIGIGVLVFDEVFKSKDNFIGWVFLFGVGILSLIIGVFFVFFPEFSLDNPLFLPTHAIILLVFGVIIVFESILIRPSVITLDLDLKKDTIAPILLKMTSIIVVAWGVYNVVWLLRRWVEWNVDPFSQWQTLLLGIGSMMIGFGIITYVELQKRKPFFQSQRVPLVGAFLLLVLSLLVTNVFLEYFSSLILPITLILSASLIAESLYLINSPTRNRHG